MSEHRIIGVHVTNRVDNAGEIQKILGKHGRIIRTRLGLHDVTESQAGPHGLILLDTVGGAADADALSSDLRGISGVQVQSMFFSDPR